MEANLFEKLGRKRTILIIISNLLVSLHTIYYYNITMVDVETIKHIQQLIRFLLTIWLFILIYQGKNWARIVVIVLSIIAVLGAIVSVFVIAQPFLFKIPFVVMIIVYFSTIYFLGFSKSYKAFANFQQVKASNFESEVL